VNTQGRSDPRLLSFVQAPCVGPGNCAQALAGTVFLDEPGTVTVRFAGQGGTYDATVRRRRVTIGPSERRTVDLPLKAGTQSFQVPIQGSGMFPQVTMFLRQGATTTRIF
jgi:hypothetical protein